jgi:alkyl hydroperoxide reductase subunit F
MYDLIIVGGGPAGVSAAVYAARKQLKTAFITDEWGGQSIVSDDIQNWIGTPHISGADLAKSLKAHVTEYAGSFVTTLSPKRVASVESKADSVLVTLASGETLEAQALLVATGANRSKLAVPGADMFEHKGLTYCASCDGPLFADMDVAVVGGGNAAFETAAQLLAYCKSVTLFNRTDKYRADEITVAKVLANPKMKAINNAELVSIEGDKFAAGIKYKVAGAESTLPVSGIFVEIGLIPNTDWLGSLVELNDVKQVVVNPWTQQTSNPRIWAAGDVTNAHYHQNNIAAGDAVKALEDIYMSLKTK